MLYLTNIKIIFAAPELLSWNRFTADSFFLLITVKTEYRLRYLWSSGRILEYQSFDKDEQSLDKLFPHPIQERCVRTRHRCRH